MSETVKLPSGKDFIVRYNYSDKESRGVIVLIVISSFSLVAVLGLMAAIAISAFNTRRSKNKHLFIRTHVFAYFLCFLLADFLHAVGSLMNGPWVQARAVIFGDHCTAQAVIKEMADVASAFWTVVIAIHTFCLLVIEIKLRPFVLCTTLVGGWAAIFAITISGPAVRQSSANGPFYGISDYWCWITPNYKAEGITLDYLLMFLAALTAFTLYGLIYLKLRGNLVIKGYRMKFVKVSAEDLAHWREKKFENESLQIAMRMWIYPMAYVVLILPMSIVRFAMWAGHKISVEVSIFASSVFLLMGIVNVTLFLTTRPVLPPESMKIRKISNPTLVKPPSPTESKSGPQHYESGLDPYYAAYFAAQEAEEEAKDLEAAYAETAHTHSPHTHSEYSQHSAHSHQHHFSLYQPPELAYMPRRYNRRCSDSDFLEHHYEHDYYDDRPRHCSMFPATGGGGMPPPPRSYG